MGIPIPPSPPRCRVATILALLLACVPLTAVADLHDSFETPQTSWELKDHDTGAFKVRAHERIFRDAHSGQACEYIRLEAKNATKIYYELEVPPGRIIDELSINVWLKSNRPKLQALARVVLPRTLDPRTNQPRRILVRGALYENVDQWEQLTVAHPARQLATMLPSLRHEFGSKVDIREAWLEAVIINAYGGPGETQLWIDDLELSGHVTTGTGAAALTSYNQATISPIEVRGSQFVVDQRPAFLRMIEYNGEPFEWLKQMGFNVICLKQPPTESDVRQANEVGIWIVAPPPDSAAAAAAMGHSPVIAWDLGQQLRRDSLEFIRTTAVAVRPSDEQLPLVTCAPAEGIREYSRSIDFLTLDAFAAGTTWELDDLGERIRRHIQQASFSGPVVVALDSEPPASTAAQWQALGFSAAQLVALEPEQLRLTAVLAASAGARGILVRSRSRLDANHSTAKLRAAALELMNFDLRLMEPWTSGGRAAGAVNVEQPLVAGYNILTEHAQLLVLCRTGSEQQHAAAPYIDEPLSILAPVSYSSVRAYYLTLAGTQPVAARRVAGGLQLDLEHLGSIGLVVLTNEGLVVDRLAQLIALSRERRAAVTQQVLGLSLELTERVDAEGRADGQQNRRNRQHLLDAAAHLQRAGQLTAERDYRAFETYTDRGMNALATIRRHSWEQAARRFTSPAATPCCTLYGALPFHWQLAERLRGRAWSGNLLVGGDMEDMQQLLASGWRRTLAPAAEENCQAELSYANPHSGRTSLLLSLRASTTLDDRAADEVPQRISSAPIPVRGGELIQIRGFVRATGNSIDRGPLLLIYDSLAGPSLAELVNHDESWREWTLYRTPLTDGSLIVHFELLRPGNVWLDTITVQKVEGDAAAGGELAEESSESVRINGPQ